MRVGNAARVGIVLLSGGLAGPALAQGAGPPSRGTHLGFGAGLVVPQDTSTLDPTWWLTVNLRIPLGSRLWLEPEVGYWPREPNRDLSLSKTINLGANLLFSSQGRPLRAWGGVGLGLHLLVYQGVLTNSEGEVVVGDDPFTNPVSRLQLLAGVDYTLSPRTTLFGVGRLDTSFIPGDDDLARQWKVYVGIRWRL